MYYVVCQTYDIDRLYDIVRLTYDIVDRDRPSPRMTSAYDIIVRRVRTISNNYDIVPTRTSKHTMSYVNIGNMISYV